MTRPVAFRFCFLFLWVSRAGADPALVVEGTAAIIGGEVITVSQVYRSRALKRFLEASEDPLELPAGDELRRAAQRALFERIVLAEMKTLSLDEGPTAEAAQKLDRARSTRKGGAAMWRRLLSRFRIKEADAVAEIAASQRVDRFVDRKVETLTPVVTPSEAERYFLQNKVRFAGMDLDAARPQVVRTLRREGLQKGIEEWVRSLQEKYQAANLVGGA